MRNRFNVMIRTAGRVVLTCFLFSFASAFDLKSAVAEINKAPSWTGMSEDNVRKDGKKLMEILVKYASIDIDDARNLVEGLILSSKTVDGFELLPEQGTYDMDVAGKIHIFNRLYCNVPETFNQKESKIFGGWIGVVAENESINILFPLNPAANGSLEIAFVFGGYKGRPYRGIQEFEFFVERFGMRKIGNSPIVGSLIVVPEEIAVSVDKPEAALLIAWEIQNKSDSLVRFRTRDLGSLMIADPDGKEVKGEVLGVDHVKKFDLKDYPVVQPDQTLYFPFAISFEVHGRLGICIKVKSDPNGQEGWIYPITKKGEYSVAAMYSVRKFSEDNPFWESEMKILSGPGFGCQNFWEGELTSKKVKIRIR